MSRRGEEGGDHLRHDVFRSNILLFPMLTRMTKSINTPINVVVYALLIL